MKLVVVFGCIAAAILIWSCEEDHEAPVAALSVNSHYGYTGRILTFSASGSTDTDNEPMALTCRWDFESDGNWDTPFNRNREVNHGFDTSGVFRVTLEMMDPDGLTAQASDTINILGPLPDSAITDPRDDQTYRVVRFNNLWIMAENLRYGRMILTDQEPSDNGVIEYYAYDNDPANAIQYGGLYSWWEAMNYDIHTYNQGICPPGWRIPDETDVDVIDLPVSHLFISDYYAKGGVSGFNIDFPGGYCIHHPDEPNWANGFLAQSYQARYWTTLYRKDSNQYSVSAKLGIFMFNANTSTSALKIIGIYRRPYFHYWWSYDGMYQRGYHSVRCVQRQRD
jgi:uncharacterized protein (TIGR02145 family)